MVIWFLGAVSTRLRLDESTVLCKLLRSWKFSLFIFESKTEYLAQYHTINCNRIDLEIPPTVSSNTHLDAAGKETINSASRLSLVHEGRNPVGAFSQGCERSFLTCVLGASCPSDLSSVCPCWTMSCRRLPQSFP